MAPGLGKLATAALPLAVRGPFSSFSTTALIPWNEATVDWSSNVHVKIKVSSLGSSGKTFIPIVDTGTVGIVITASETGFYDFSKTCAQNGGTEGWEFLSSSKVLYEGCWIPQDVYFNYQASSPNPVVKTNVPILAATYRTVCKTMVPEDAAGPSPPVCTDPGAERVANYTGIRMMGIGWGREYDGQPQGTPDKNPLRHISSIGTQDMALFRNGYIIEPAGLRVGLTDGNTAGMAFYALNTHATVAGDYAEAAACIKIDATACVRGTALLDTGVGHSYMRMPLGTRYTHRDEVNTSPTYHHLTTGAVVHLEFGTVGAAPAAVEDYVVGTPSTPDVNPDYAKAENPNRPTYVNTGRHIYRKYVTAVDFVSPGRYGFRTV